MSAKADWQDLQHRMAGKWQVPLMAASVMMLGYALVRLTPPAAELPWDDALRHLAVRVDAGDHRQAVDLGDKLLLREDITRGVQSQIHLQLGRARFDWASDLGLTRSDIGAQIIDHYEQAGAMDLPLLAYDHERMGHALEWQGKIAQAVRHYDGAFDRGDGVDVDLRWHALVLRLDHLAPTPPQTRELLDAFMGELGDRRLDLRLWAIERRIDLHDATETLDEATTLLTRNAGVFDGTPLQAHIEFLEAWLLYRMGHYNDAEAHARLIRNRVGRTDPVYAMTGWLLGRVVLSDDGPERPLEALSFFSDVLKFHDGTSYSVASRIGAGEALALLERYDESLESFRVAVEDLPSVSENHAVSREVLRTTLSVLADTQRIQNQLGAAVAFARLARQLVEPSNVEQAALMLEQLAGLEEGLAHELDHDEARSRAVVDHPVSARSEEARNAFAMAAESYIDLARVDAINERRAAGAIWRAAEMLATAGLRERAIALYRSFIVERPDHSLVPRAMLRVGQLLQMSGDLAGAVEAYQVCYRRFPRSLDGSRALIPLARSYMAMGSDHAELAERTLRIILDDSEVFTPQAPEFAEALFLLGEAVYRRGDYEQAIATLEEALGRYPGDPRRWQATFLLADAFRQSGLALKGEIGLAKFAEEIVQMRHESKSRFDEAQRLYHRIIEEYEDRGAHSLQGRESIYLKHAYLYEADCFFENQNYRRALKLYEQAAGLYKDTASALAAYVQMINSHVFLGQPEEARVALARARVLVDAIPDAAFAASISPETREDWKRYFDWLGDSELF